MKVKKQAFNFSFMRNTFCFAHKTATTNTVMKFQLLESILAKRMGLTEDPS